MTVCWHCWWGWPGPPADRYCRASRYGQLRDEERRRRARDGYVTAATSKPVPAAWLPSRNIPKRVWRLQPDVAWLQAVTDAETAWPHYDWLLRYGQYRRKKLFIVTVTWPEAQPGPSAWHWYSPAAATLPLCLSLPWPYGLPEAGHFLPAEGTFQACAYTFLVGGQCCRGLVAEDIDYGGDWYFDPICASLPRYQYSGYRWRRYLMMIFRGYWPIELQCIPDIVLSIHCWPIDLLLLHSLFLCDTTNSVVIGRRWRKVTIIEYDD